MGLVTPHQLDMWSSQVSELYNSLEGEVIRSIIERLSVKEIESVQKWQMQKLQQLNLFNSDVTQTVAAVTGRAEEEVRRMFEETVNGTIEEVDERIPGQIKPTDPTAIDQVMKGFFDQSWSEVENYVNQTLVTTNYGRSALTQAYVDTLNRTSALFNTGIYTFEQALEKSIVELAEKGIQSNFIDKGGNRWSMERYVQTVLKSTLNNTYNKVKTDRMAEYGVYTVLVTAHMGARQACQFIQGNVVDLRLPSEIPEESEYKSIHDADWGARYQEPSGHRGINCTHQHIPFMPGVNKNNQPQYDVKENAEVAKNQTTQRSMERNIVKYKKRLMIAEKLGSPNVEKYTQLVDKWEQKISTHLDENGAYLSRNLARERVYTPLSTLLKDERK